MNLSHQATRIDGETGIREIAGFFGPGRMRMFGLTHLPPDGASGGVLICSPLQAEFVRNYRREVLLGRLLAAQGLAVQRFHYRGCGNSDGDPSSPTFESMLEDTLSATDRLMEIGQVSRLAFVGTRFGGLMAAAASTKCGATPVAMWEPVVSVADYFAEVLRTRLIQNLKNQRNSSRSRVDPITELRRGGGVDVLGYSIGLPLYESGLERRLEQELGGEPRSMLLVQLGGAGRLRPEYKLLVSRLEQSGFALDVESLPHKEAWWFAVGIDDGAGAIVEPTARWLKHQLPPLDGSNE